MKHTLLSFLFILFTCGLSAQSVTGFGQAEDLRVFPNPVVEYFQLGFTERVATLSLMNMAGRVVKKFTHTPNQQYNISELHRGYYLLQLRDRENRVIKTVRINKP